MRFRYPQARVHGDMETRGGWAFGNDMNGTASYVAVKNVWGWWVVTRLSASRELTDQEQYAICVSIQASLGQGDGEECEAEGCEREESSYWTQVDAQIEDREFLAREGK